MNQELLNMMILEKDVVKKNASVQKKPAEEPARGPLTDLEEPPRFEHLEQRMIYAARLRPAEAINIGLNPLVSAAAELLSLTGLTFGR